MSIYIYLHKHSILDYHSMSLLVLTCLSHWPWLIIMDEKKDGKYVFRWMRSHSHSRRQWAVRHPYLSLFSVQAGYRSRHNPYSFIQLRWSSRWKSWRAQSPAFQRSEFGRPSYTLQVRRLRDADHDWWQATAGSCDCAKPDGVRRNKVTRDLPRILWFCQKRTQIGWRPASLWRVSPRFFLTWSCIKAHQAHKLKVAGSNPAPATKLDH